MRTVAALCRDLLPDRRSDGDLLAAFAAERSEVPFAELVRRHGPLVWGTCRRLLPDPADAEDAFQATFLVLVRQANRLAARDTVGPWLHRVAVLTARNVRRKNARRLVRQRELPDELPTPAPDSDLRADIDAALLALPARLRDPIILCHLQGFTRREAAERLGCPEGTLSSWLDRGLAKLRVRLRDFDPTKALGVPAVAVPLVLTANTTKAAVASGVAAAAIPPAITSIVEGVLHMLWIKKATVATVALCAVFALGVGVGLGTRPGATGVAAEDGPPKLGTPKPAGGPKPANNAQEIADLEARIRAREAFLEAINAALSKLKAEQSEGKAATEEYARLRDHAAATAAGLQELKKQLAKAKGGEVSSTPTAGDDPAMKLEALRARLARLDAEKLKLAAESAIAEQRRALLDAETAELRRTVDMLAAQDQRNKGVAAPAGYLELTVSAKGNTPEFVIREVAAEAAEKKALGPVTTTDPAALAVLLKRAKADPNGPQEARILGSGDTPSKYIVTASEACKAAGFKAVRADITGENKKPPADAPGGRAADRFGDLQKLEEQLRQLQQQREDELRQLRRAQDELQEQRRKRETNPKP